MARLLYQSKLNSVDKYGRRYIRWIPFNEFGNIEYLAKGGFGEVHKATWIGYYYRDANDEYKEEVVVLKRIYNSINNILDTLKEVNKKSLINTNVDLLPL